MEGKKLTHLSLPYDYCLATHLVNCMMGGKRKSAELFRKSKRVQESRDPESAEGTENSIRIVALARGFWGA